MSTLLSRARGAAAQLEATLAASAWTPILGKAAAYLLGFALLALIGSGRAARWITPAPNLGIAVAEAATAPPSSTPALTAPTAPAPPPEPTAAEVAAGPADGGAPLEGADAGASSGVAADGKVILNLATEQDLRRLPGIGHGRAQAILALRERLKKFSRVEDLLKVKGIGRRGLARLRPMVRVD
jgi:competence protein ComEA